MTTIMIYDADLPIHMKGGMVKLKQTVESIINKNTDFESLSSIILELDNELTFGLNQIRNNGYITEGMEKGEPAPDWVPIKKEDAVKEAMQRLKKDFNLNTSEKIDKRSKKAYTEEEWEQKKQEKKEKMNDKKRKLEEYESLCEKLEHYKEEANSYKNKFLKCKEYLLSNDIEFTI